MQKNDHASDSLLLDNKTTTNEPEQITYDIFSKWAERCALEIQDEEIITLDRINKASPEFYQKLIHFPEQVSLYCFADLLNMDTNTIILDPLPNLPSPSSFEEFECAVARCLVSEFDEEKVFVQLDEESSNFEWLTRYHRYALDIFTENYYNIDATFYSEHPILKQYTIAILREPSWRIFSATPFVGDYYDQEVYFDGINAILIYLETGKSQKQVACDPIPTMISELCTEDVSWELSQNANCSVTLLIYGNGSETTITYTP